MTDSISTPLGTLIIHQPDRGPALAQGTLYEGHPEGVFFSIQVNQEHSTEHLPYGFIRDKLHHLDRYCQHARQFLIAEFGCPDGEESTFITHPEVTFWDDLYWSVRFAEGTLDICRPNGVLVHWKGEQIIGYDDLSVRLEV